MIHFIWKSQENEFCKVVGTMNILYVNYCVMNVTKCWKPCIVVIYIYIYIYKYTHTHALFNEPVVQCPPWVTLDRSKVLTMDCIVLALASSWRQETGKPASRYPGPCGPRACIEVNQGSLVFWVCWFFLRCLRFGLFVYFAKWLVSGTVSRWCLCRAVSLHKDKLLQDALIFKQKKTKQFVVLVSFSSF